MSIFDSILAELEQEAVATGKLLERLPEDNLTWKPHPKSMSLGQLALHIATLPGVIATYAEQGSVDVATLVHHPEAKSKAEIVEGLTRSLATAKELLSHSDDDKATSCWSVTKDGKAIFSLPRLALFRVLLLNHWYHHRGQLTVYLRLLDIPLSSVYGPSADENPFA